MEQQGEQRRDGPGLGTVVVVAVVVSTIVSGTVALGVGAVAAALWARRSPATLTRVTPVPTAPERTDETEDEPEVKPVDAAWEEVVEGRFTPDDHTARVYRFTLPSDAVYVRADLTGGDTDLDLRVTFGDDAARDADWRVTSNGSDGDEFAWVARDGDDAFGRKPFLVRVDCYAAPDTECDYTLELTVVRHEVASRLAPGDRVTGAVSEENGHRTAYEVVMPADADVVRLDLVGVRQDLDLAADVGPVLDASHAPAAALSSVGRETLLLDRGELRLGPGEAVLNVVVIDRGWLDRLIPFTLAISAGAEAPPDVRQLPALPRGRSPAERAAVGVVALMAGEGEGSGVVVGPAGRILTAAHVVEEVELGSPEVVISVITDIGLEPEEVLRGKVIRSDPDLDVAIVEVTSTLYGDPLPDGWSLPRTPVRWSAPALLGEDVRACGYPVLHEGRERSEVTWTSGVVCGFETPDGGPLVRFDAVISSGSSGGALLDADDRLLGITIAMHGDLSEFSATGLALPVSEIPADWLELLR